MTYNKIQAHKYYIKNKKKMNSQSWAWQKSHPKTVKKIKQRYRTKLKMQIMELLGNKCSNPDCYVLGGCKDLRCLQIDHVHGGGCKERKFHSEERYRRIRDKILSGSKEYQLLCANCNWIKRVENKEQEKRY
jgi:RNase P subunit RPR2